MTPAGSVALGIVVFGALSYGAASILQAVAARRSTSTVRTMSHPLYLAGIGCDVLAWVGSMVALRELAVYLVESVLAGSLAVTVVAARFVLRSRLRRRDVAAVAVTIAALAVLALSAGEHRPVTASTELRVVFGVAAVTVVSAGWAATRMGVAGVVAALAGLSLGGAALIGRVLPTVDGPLYTEPLVAALLIFAGNGMMLYAGALQLGDVGPVTAVHWTAEVVAPSAVALLLLGDTVRPGWGLPALVAGLATVGAAVLLATAPATRATAHAGETPAVPAVPAEGAGPASATPLPVLPVPAVGLAVGDRIIWWGPPPIWRPPPRASQALPRRSADALTWNPPVVGNPAWTQRRPADGHAAPLPVPVVPGPAHELPARLRRDASFPARPSPCREARNGVEA